MVRWGASRMAHAGVYCGHGFGEVIDESLALVLHALALPHGLPDALLGSRLTRDERRHVASLVTRRINERVPTAYLTGEAWFAGHRFIADARALVPRSPFAELIERDFAPWLDGIEVTRALDVGTGGGCIAVAMALAWPDAEVDAVDVEPAALALAAENVVAHGVEDRVTLLEGDLFAPLGDERYDLIVANPPYVPEIDVDGAPAEFAHEPRGALAAGDDGLDIVRRLLAEAPRHLAPHGVLMVEVGASWVAVESTWPDLPLTWVDLERGGDGIFAIDREALELVAP